MKKCTCNEIKSLHGREGQEYSQEHLRQITVDVEKWQTLYKCPDTGIYWKEYFSYPEAHAGGPPDFVQISEGEAIKEFNF